MEENFTPLTQRWFNLVTDLAQTGVKTMVLAEERTMELTHSLLNQVVVVKEQGEGLVKDFNGEMQRTKVLVQETVDLVKKFQPRQPNLRLPGRPGGFKNLPAPNPFKK